MVGGQRATPGKSIRFGGLSWIEVDTGRGLTAPIVDRIRKLDSSPDTIRYDVEESRIGHGQVRTPSRILCKD